MYLPFPNGLHAEWIIAAAEAGKDILCEKPLVGSLEDYSRAVEACQRNNVTLMEAFMYRFHPQHQKVREFIDGGPDRADRVDARAVPLRDEPRTG